jgi:hypothetical protein
VLTVPAGHWHAKRRRKRLTAEQALLALQVAARESPRLSSSVGSLGLHVHVREHQTGRSLLAGKIRQGGLFLWGCDGGAVLWIPG